MSIEKIRITIAGHTNTGKTTLIRTLMKSSVGEVGDSPNVTKKGEAYFYDSLQATFVDTPGFRFAGICNMYLDGKSEDPDFKLPKKWQEKIALDLDAINTIKDSDVVIYVGGLRVVPDDGYEEEMAVVRKLQPKVIGLLNQAHSQLEASSQEELDHRIKLWKSTFNQHGVENVVVFDAHWDKPSKLNLLYENISQVLSEEQNKVFSLGLKAFKERQYEIRREACERLATCIDECQDIVIETTKIKYKEEKVKKDLNNQILGSILSFTRDVNELYKVAAEYPTTPKEELKINKKESVNFTERLGLGASVAAVLGGGGAAAGAVIGGALAGLFTGGLGVGAGAVLGAQIGGVIGGATGSIAAFDDDSNDVIIRMQSQEIEGVVTKCLAIIWGLSNNGYGRDRKVSEEEMKNLSNQINALQESSTYIDWTITNEVQIIDYCEKMLDKLEAVL